MHKIYIASILMIFTCVNESKSQIKNNDTTIIIDFFDNQEYKDNKVVYENMILYCSKNFKDSKLLETEIFRIDDKTYLKKVCYESGKIKEIGKLIVDKSKIKEGPEHVSTMDPITGELKTEIYLSIGVLKDGLWQYYDDFNNESSGNYSGGLKTGKWNYYTSWRVGGVYSPHRLSYSESFVNNSTTEIEFENIVLTKNNDSIRNYLINGVWRFQSYDSIGFSFNSGCGHDDCKQLFFRNDSIFKITRIESPYENGYSYKDNSYLSGLHDGRWKLDGDIIYLTSDSGDVVLKIKYLSKGDLIVSRIGNRQQ